MVVYYYWWLSVLTVPLHAFLSLMLHLPEDMLTAYPGDYAGKLVEYCMVKIYSQIRVRETKQTWSEEPQLKVEVIYGTLQGL